MNTLARVAADGPSHFYMRDGTPLYEVPYADPSKGMRKATLADARKVSALPSVTTVLSVLDKPGLTAWKMEQAVLAAITSPRLPGEADDAFIHRVLHQERQQDQEAQQARDRGTRIHDAMQGLMEGKPIPFDQQDLCAWVDPVYRWMREYAGTPIHSEVVMVGDGYAGRTDLITQQDRLGEIIWDYKSCKRLPDKKGYPEHLLQCAAYSQCRQSCMGAGNVYISTTEPGRFVVIEYSNEELREAYERGFKPLLEVWKFINRYDC